MFGKLMKYELRYLIRIFAPMWAVVLALCALSRLTLNPDVDGMMYVEGSEAVLPVVIVMLTVFGIITMMIVATVVLLQRFYKGMYGDEGYLMFTLPVTSGSLIHSKGLSALLMMTATELITVLGIVIMVSYPGVWHMIDMNVEFDILLETYGLDTMKFVALTFWSIVVVLLSIVQEIYIIYLAISVGQLWKKHPVAGAIIAYYIIMLLIGTLLNALNDQFAGFVDMVVNSVSGSAEFGATMVIALVATSIYNLILIAISFYGTKIILDKKLNIA